VSDVIRSYWWVLARRRRARVGRVRYSMSTPARPLRWDQWKLRMPVVGELLRKMEVASLARTLGTLLKSGVPLLQSLSIVREIVGNQVIARALGEVEVGRAGGRRHRGTARALRRLPAARGADDRRRRGDRPLDELLIKVAEHFDREVRTAIQQFTRLLEPALIVVMGSRGIHRRFNAVGDLQPERSADVRRVHDMRTRNARRASRSSRSWSS
jgi:general secretion pathway protein F